MRLAAWCADRGKPRAGVPPPTSSPSGVAVVAARGAYLPRPPSHLCARHTRRPRRDCGVGTVLSRDGPGRLGWKTVGTEIALAAVSRAAAGHRRIVGDLE